MDSRPRSALAALAGAVVIGADLVLIRTWPDESQSGWRVLPALAAATFYLILTRGDRASLGLIVNPLQGWLYWCKATAALGGIIGGWIIAVVGIWVFSGRELPLYPVPPSQALTEFVRMCVLYPLLEETIYRMALCVPFAALIRPAGAIALGGVLFGLLHVFYGNPGPDNLVAGFFLAWAFLKSGTIVVPLLLHSLGNACVFCARIATWYWLVGGGGGSS